MDLFTRYLPIYVFHQEETNFPIDFKDYLSQSSLIKNGKSRYNNVSCLCEGCPFIISKNNPIRETISGEVIIEKGKLTYETPPIPNIDNGKDCYLEYYGNLTIQEYRKLLKNERLLLIVDKPLIRVLPELHEDTDDYLLNYQGVPPPASATSSQKYLLRRHNKFESKNDIVNQQFNLK